MHYITIYTRTSRGKTKIISHAIVYHME